MMDGISELFATLQQELFQRLLQPLMFRLGMGNLLEDGYAATGWLLMGLLQLAVLLLVVGPMQRWRPVQPLSDRASVRVDVLYTLIHRLGLFRVGFFLLIEPWLNDALGVLRARGWSGWQLDQLWPGVTDVAWVSFAVYLVALDFLSYWLHRAQHQFNWWWALHSLHHSQRDMSMWTDNRNHLLSDLLTDVLFAVLALAVGVPPGQFMAAVALTQLCESFQHANVRIHFGKWGERLIVSPRFHRLHHSMGIGHESHGKHTLGGANFGVLFPWWDIGFGTANFAPYYAQTGVRDQVEPDEHGRLRDYGQGFVSQQWLGLLRLLGRA